MKRLGTLLVALVAWLPMVMPASAAERLEDVSEGKFKASGKVRQYPGWPVERLFCRMSGQKTDKRSFEIVGRCANATNSAPIKLQVEVVEAGKRYRMISRTLSRTLSLEGVLNYTGIRRGSNVIFNADAMIDGVKYKSRFTISINSNGINRIVEQVTKLDNDATTTLIDISVQRE